VRSQNGGCKHCSKDRKGRGGGERSRTKNGISMSMPSKESTMRTQGLVRTGGEGVGEGVGVRKVGGLGSEVGWECQWSSCKKGRRRGGGGSSQRLGRTNPTDGDMCTQLVV